MITERFMEIYFWGCLVWFAGLFVVLAIPAAREVKKLLSAKKD